MAKYRVGVIALRMGAAWARAVTTNPLTDLTMVYDKNYDRNDTIDRQFFEGSGCKILKREGDIYKAGLDIIIVASPDHFHTEQSIKALNAGCNVICEKPLAPTVADCRKIITAVKKTKKLFMTGQVCRYAPGFMLTKKLIEDGRIGEIAFMESEYAHDYTKSPGFDNWRKDHKIKREGFLGGGCHALDLARWFVGDPIEVSSYMNRKLLAETGWPTNDTGVAICRFKNDVIGKVFVSVGVKRPYSMRTVICGTAGTIICDNTSQSIQIFEEKFATQTGRAFATIPVDINNHNVTAELDDFVKCLDEGLPIATDVYEGTRTVAFAEAAIKSANTGAPIKVEAIK